MERNKYSREELAEFRQIIMDKVSRAREEFNTLKEAVSENKTSSSESGAMLKSRRTTSSASQRPPWWS